MAGENSLFVSKRQIGASSTDGSNANAYPGISGRADLRSPRFIYWFAFFIISVIVSGSAMEAVGIVGSVVMRYSFIVSHFSSSS